MREPPTPSDSRLLTPGAKINRVGPVLSASAPTPPEHSAARPIMACKHAHVQVNSRTSWRSARCSPRLRVACLRPHPRPRIASPAYCSRPLPRTGGGRCGNFDVQLSQVGEGRIQSRNACQPTTPDTDAVGRGPGCVRRRPPPSRSALRCPGTRLNLRRATERAEVGVLVIDVTTSAPHRALLLVLCATHDRM